MIDSVSLIFKLIPYFAHPVHNYFPSAHIWRSRVVYFADMHPRYHLFKDFIQRSVTLECESSFLSVGIIHRRSYCLSGYLAVGGALADHKKPAILTITTDNTAADLNR